MKASWDAIAVKIATMGQDNRRPCVDSVPIGERDMSNKYAINIRNRVEWSGGKDTRCDT